MHNNKSNEFDSYERQIAEIGKILSHPARISIISLIVKKKEIKAGDISDYLPISRTTVSKHLKDLKMAGIIKGNIDGPKIHYCIDMQKLAMIRQVLNEFLDKTISDFLCKC